MNRGESVKLALIGSGEWGSRVAHIASLIKKFDFIGTINSQTSEEDKNSILSQCDLMYIAVNPENQIDYVNYGLSAYKDVICESPFLAHKTQRDDVIKTLSMETALERKRLFYVNYPYIMDNLLAKAASAAITKPFKFMSVKCYGPKFHDNALRAKKLYSCQAMNVILQIMATRTHRFDKMNLHDNNCGEFIYRDAYCMFGWGHADKPRIEMQVNGEGFAEKTEFGYDEYDQILPLFFYYLSTVRAADNNGIIPPNLAINTLLHSASAEHFSDLFTALNGQKVTLKYEDLIFGGMRKQ